MKGVIFTEFLDMVEDRFSPEIADQIIEQTEPASGGAYTAVGTYDHAEIVAMVVALSEEADLPVPDLLRAFGQHLFGQLADRHPEFLTDATTAFEFLRQVESVIHVEVRKLYPDAEVPALDCAVDGDERMTMVYSSPRGMADVALGLIEGCIDHFKEAIDVGRTDLSGDPGTHTRFDLVRRQAAA